MASLTVLKRKKGCHRSYHLLLILLAVIVASSLATLPAAAVGTTAGTSITATATVSYEDANGNADSTSESVQVTVRHVAGLSITAGTAAQSIKPGTAADYPVTITNTGNDSDTFDLAVSLPAAPAGWTALIYRDDDGDGLRDAGETTVVTDSGSLAADATAKFIVVVTAPSTAVDSTAYDATFTATSQLDANTSRTSTFSTKITDVSLAVTITASPTNPQPGDTVTYTFTLANTGTGTATNIAVSNSIPTDTTYTAGSISIGDQAKTDASDGDGATYNAGTIVIDQASLAGNTSVSWTYQVTINDYVDPNTPISNQATGTFTDTANQEKSVTSETDTSVQVAQKNAPAVTIDTPTSVSALPGDTVISRLSISNKGNVTDTFDITLSWTEGSFEWKLYLDSDNDGVKDSATPVTVKIADQNEATATTGAMTKNTTQHYIAELVVPTNTADGASDTLTLTATSQSVNDATATGTFTVNINAPDVAVTITASTPEPAPREEVTFTVTATNSGHAPAKNVMIEIPIPNNTTYKPGSVYVDGTVQADGTVFSSQDNKITVTKASDLAVSGSFEVSFTVTVD